jgi:DNA-binding IclR family transcriptional regulator
MSPVKAQGGRATIQSIDRAAGILTALGSGPVRLGVSELADRLGLARPTVHGLLQTLVLHGFVEQDAASEKYQLGPGLLQLGYAYLDVNELRIRSVIHAARLADRTGMAVRAGARNGTGVLVVHHVFRPEDTLQIPEVGLQLPIHASALGKAVLAHLDADAVGALVQGQLPKLTKHTLSAARLLQQLKEIRDQGFAAERDEAVIGESSVGAPIFDRTGAAVGAIGVVGETERIFPRGLARGTAPAVIEAARGISRELGVNRWPAGS